MAIESSLTEVLPTGAPCWVELATGDEQRALEFYAGLFGWQYRVTPDSTVMTGRYAIAYRDGYAVAGVFQTDRPGGWVPHIAVSDTVSGAERVDVCGGRVELGPIDFPRYDSMVYARDPLGAPVVLRTPPSGWLFTTGAPGTFASADLNTRDGFVADEFYCRMFGFVSVQLGDGVDIDYAEWQLDGIPVLYRYVMGPEYSATTPAHWMTYFVADPLDGTDGTAVRALRLGGGIAVQPYDSALGRVVILVDPGGAAFAVIDPTDSPENRRAPVEDPDSD
jgi:predicted enzyme related to lactoylglutathione lyase